MVKRRAFPRGSGFWFFSPLLVLENGFDCPINNQCRGLELELFFPLLLFLLFFLLPGCNDLLWDTVCAVQDVCEALFAVWQRTSNASIRGEEFVGE